VLLAMRRDLCSARRARIDEVGGGPFARCCLRAPGRRAPAAGAGGGARQVGDFIEAARAAIRAGEHPKEETPHNCAWQVRVLGTDHRAAYEELAIARKQIRALGRVEA
jgi:hypothetical protein